MSLIPARPTSPPATAEPRMKLGIARAGSAAPNGIAPSVINDKPMIMFVKPELRSSLVNLSLKRRVATKIASGGTDPARAIPSFILGSAVAGGLVGLTGIKLMAPHGGIFVIALTSNALLYLVSVLVGAIVSGVVYGYLRKPQAVK